MTKSNLNAAEQRHLDKLLALSYSERRQIGEKYIKTCPEGIVTQSSLVFAFEPLEQYRLLTGSGSMLDQWSCAFLNRRDHYYSPNLEIKTFTSFPEMKKTLMSMAPRDSAYIAVPVAAAYGGPGWMFDPSANGHMWLPVHQDTWARVFGWGFSERFSTSWQEIKEKAQNFFLEKKKKRITNKYTKLGFSSVEDYVRSVVKEKAETENAKIRLKTVEQLFDITEQMRIYEDRKASFEKASVDTLLGKSTLSQYRAVVRELKKLNSLILRDLKES